MNSTIQERFQKITQETQAFIRESESCQAQRVQANREHQRLTERVTELQEQCRQQKAVQGAHHKTMAHLKTQHESLQSKWQAEKDALTAAVAEYKRLESKDAQATKAYSQELSSLNESLFEALEVKQTRGYLKHVDALVEQKPELREAVAKCQDMAAQVQALRDKVLQVNKVMIDDEIVFLDR